jgi:galactonate dehydratase
MRINQVVIYDVDYGRTFLAYFSKLVIVRINTDGGPYGVGEVALSYGTGVKAAIAMVASLAEQFLLGADASRIEAIWDTFFRQTWWGKSAGPILYGAISAIDEALWDIKGKTLGVPAYQLLGGKTRDTIRLYANGWYTDEASPEQYAEAALRVIAEGYDAMKLDPFGFTPDGRWDPPGRHIERERMLLGIRRIEAIRRAVGDDVEIALDFHGNLGTTDAILCGRMLEAARPFFIEEPVDAMNPEAMRKVSQNLKVPIAAGERLYTRYQFRPYIEAQSLDIVQPDIGLCGGITEAHKIAAYAETYNLHVQPHNCGGPVATAVAVQLDAVIPNFIIQEWFPRWSDDRFSIVTEPFEPQTRAGRFNVPDRPGLGVELNEDYLARFDKIEVR